ncbi:hypothetical protein GOBAR_DD17997 [Gossypium barbadense]|nr:hypothetical protein GOBAR_DD17997 [Gossypium barbadense]
MELVDDEDVETIVALYCGTQSNKNAPIQLFAELAGVEATEDPTPLGEEDGVEAPCMVVPVISPDLASVQVIHYKSKARINAADPNPANSKYGIRRSSG